MKTMRTLPAKLAAAVLAATLISGAGESRAAVTIQWGSSVWSNTFTSDGTSFSDPGLQLGDYTFELGSFSGFEPTESNVSAWRDNWATFDTATFDPGTLFLTSEIGFAGDGMEGMDSMGGSVDLRGQQAYIWGYNDLSPTPGSEWVLITGNVAAGANTDSSNFNWFFPPNGGTQEDLLLQWRPSTADTVPFGGLDGTQGGGEFTSNPPGYELQTHTFIPEPGVSLLLALGGLQLLLCRRRDRHC